MKQLLFVLVTNMCAHKTIGYYLSISVLALVLTCLVSCAKHSVRLTADAIESRADMPVLSAHEVTTLISDSGVTRYRITAASWQIYDKATPPHWEFPEGVYLEQFNTDLSVVAFMQADYAYYDENAQLWRLDGNVHSQNVAGERFETPQLFWDQAEERIYSDSTIAITRATSIINGIGFESNQDMSQYTILHPTGIIPIDENQ